MNTFVEDLSTPLEISKVADNAVPTRTSSLPLYL